MMVQDNKNFWWVVWVWKITLLFDQDTNNFQWGNIMIISNRPCGHDELNYCLDEIVIIYNGSR